MSDFVAPAIVDQLEDRILLTTNWFTNDSALAIPDAGAQVSSGIVVSHPGAITRLNVHLNVEHEAVEDLDILLRAPDGTTITLSTDNGFGVDDDHYLHTTFTTNPNFPSITTGSAPFTGIFTPEGNLKQFLSRNPTGTWQLLLQDDSSGTAGQLLNWGLEITTAASFSNTTDFSIPDNGSTESSISVSGLTGNVSQVQVRVNITHGYTPDLDISLVAPNGSVINLSSDNGTFGDGYTNTIFQTDEGSIGPNEFPSITTASDPFTGAFKPEGSISAIQGINPNGNWKLRVTDDDSGVSGTLRDWTLAITTAPNLTAIVAGDTIIVNAPLTSYDQSSLVLHLGEPVTATPVQLFGGTGTKINGGTVVSLNAKFISLIGNMGNGDDTIQLTRVVADRAMQNLSLNMGAGSNRLIQSNVNNVGPTFINSLEGTVTVAIANSILSGLTVLGGRFNDNVLFDTMGVLGPTTLLLGGRDDIVAMQGAQLGGFTTIITTGQLGLGLANNTRVLGLTAISGAGFDQVESSGSLIRGPFTLLLGGGTNRVVINGGTYEGFVLIESALGSLDFEMNGGVMQAGLLVIGGITSPDSVEFTVANGLNDFRSHTTFLLGGGFNSFVVNANTSTALNVTNGMTMIDSSAGTLFVDMNRANLAGGLLLIGGVSTSDSITIANTRVDGITTMLLGGGTSNGVTFAGDFFNGPFTLIASSVVSLVAEFAAPNGTNTTFQGAALFLVGGGSNLRFGHDPLPSDPIRFNTSLTIISGIPNSTVRRRNVTITGTPIFIGVNLT